MKKILIATSLILATTSTLATGWSNMSFPIEKPIYHTIGKFDEAKEAKLNFSCMKGNENILLMSLSKTKLEKETGTFGFVSSVKDTYPTGIKGKFNTSEDGTINLFAGDTKEVVLHDLKKLNGVTLILRNEGKQIKKLNYSLSGSSKNLNILTTKCNKLK